MTSEPAVDKSWRIRGEIAYRYSRFLQNNLLARLAQSVYLKSSLFMDERNTRARKKTQHGILRPSLMVSGVVS